ncbi:putative periplasmic protein [Enhygromyxa salina]|uniref:Putative periplasmic protein n=1 Tax=Enhygromyxa salina TaxID=215803 RepID=A0A0C2D408_9BACT|nr:DUF459 domain-containing protein [Enhygromyxa salina]KIG14832.1 putative periplasmic protein [Enhygromyxa salina]
MHSRRSFSIGLSAALAAVLLPRRGQAGSAKIMVLGGSTIHGALGKNIETALADAGFTTQRHAKSSSGLARPDFYDWPAAAKGYCQRFAPDAIVVMFGGNDGQALFMGEDAKPKWIRWEDEGWKPEYRARVEAFADAVAPNGERIFWMGMPEMKSNKLDGRMKRMNGIYEAVMTARANGHYLSTRGLMPGVQGYSEFAKIDGKQVRVRTEDGVHYSLHGARIVADAIVPAVAKAV